ncbi:unnamed protein product [Cuscuta campestris]|uniref:Uncharacterized protein n=1 Tax=Cuscuta campestris TaxID=132261 RepID=A0A484M6K7_9ASTE|nr:unnamed protein product [Cuscuta campestris]
MAPKGPNKVTDRIKTGCILDPEGFLKQHQHSDVARKIIDAFQDCGLMKFLAFPYSSVQKEEVLEWYLHAKVEADYISSTVGEKPVTITANDIRVAFALPEATEKDFTSHTFDHETFWAEIKNEKQADEINFRGKKKDLLNPVFERAIDIIYKCLESRVAGVDDVTPDKIKLLSAIMNNIKCNWARHIYNCLCHFVHKASVKSGDKELRYNCPASTTSGNDLSSCSCNSVTRNGNVVAVMIFEGSDGEDDDMLYEANVDDTLEFGEVGLRSSKCVPEKEIIEELLVMGSDDDSLADNDDEEEPKALKDLLWEAAKATTVPDFELVLSEIEEENVSAYTPKAGRPKKKRKKSAGEMSKDGKKINPARLSRKCGRCIRVGHNKKTCPDDLTIMSKQAVLKQKKKKMKPKRKMHEDPSTTQPHDDVDMPNEAWWDQVSLVADQHTPISEVGQSQVTQELLPTPALR